MLWLIFSNQPVKNNWKTYINIQKIATGQGDDYTTGCLLDYNYFNKHYKMVAIDLSKQQVLHANPKAIQQINFTGDLAQDPNANMFFVIEEAKETIFDFSQRNVIVFCCFFFFNFFFLNWDSLHARLLFCFKIILI